MGQARFEWQAADVSIAQQGRNLDLLTITEPELAETEIDPQARKVNAEKSGSLILGFPGEEEGGDGDGSPAPRRESSLLCRAGQEHSPCKLCVLCFHVLI